MYLKGGVDDNCNLFLQFLNAVQSSKTGTCKLVELLGEVVHLGAENHRIQTARFSRKLEQ